MLRKGKNKIKTVSEKVTELILKQNGAESSDDSAEEATAPKVIDFEEDYDLPDERSTEFRKRNVKLLSEQSARYKGKIVSRRDLEDDEEDEDEGDDTDDDDDDEDEDDVQKEEESDSDNEALEAFGKKLKMSNKNGIKNNDTDEDDSEDEYANGAIDSDKEENDSSEADSEQNDEDDDDENSEDEDDEEEDIEDFSENEETTTDMITENNRQAEIQKGVCVQNQLRIWEKLLELRINSQKLLSKANQLPSADELKEQQNDNEEIKQASVETTTKTCALLNSLLNLQQTLTNQFSETKSAMKNTRKRNSPFENVNGNEAPPLKRIANYLEQRHEEFRSYRNSVLLKWDDRTKLLTPGAGAKKKSLNEEYDIIRKIDNALLNRSALIEKTQTLKNSTIAPTNGQADNKVEVLKDTTTCQVNANIYDDSDFYHQQLRELIEYKSNTSSNMTEITKQFVELQKLRQKMKKKVDTRASKGRKLRYTVHNKLLNFMAPDETADTWTDESKNELYKSLFAT